ncbi:hypothetical protein [Bartonella sp. AC134YNZD]|uniref:hypothetical protein n=1 Tax=Bartonella sp. AC134YNZD TaxID=3243446 RepID=UPI0035CFABF0
MAKIGDSSTQDPLIARSMPIFGSDLPKTSNPHGGRQLEDGEAAEENVAAA